MSLKSIVSTVVTVLPVLSAGLYVLGSAYHQGHLALYGLEDVLFSVPADRTLVSGFVAFMSIAAPSAVYAAMAVLVVFCAIVCAALLSSSSWVKRLADRFGRWRVRRPAPTALGEAMDKNVERSAILAIYSLGAMMITVLLLLAAVLSGQSGRKEALREIEAFAKGSIAHVEVTIEGGPSLARAKPVICGSAYCAFWTGAESVVVRMDKIERIVAHAPPNVTARP